MNATLIETVRTFLRIFLLFTLLVPAAIASADDNPITTNNRFLYGGLQKLILASVEKVPADAYGFKPTEAIRSFGQLVGHVADSQYTFCSIAIGEKRPTITVEKSKTSKDELVAALKDAFAYCDKAYASVNDANAAETVKVFRRDMPRLGVLGVNNLHTSEHYGNIITYLRLRNIVPPSSDPEFMKKLNQ
jgi:uncharacterized damage-inducible protein DinB